MASVGNPLYTCLSPLRVYNKYIDEHVYVSCGKCDACLNARSLSLFSRVQREMDSPRNASCYFVTLTYDNANLPLYTLEEDGYFRSNRYRLDPRFSEISFDECRDYVRPQRIHSDSFGHLAYVDVQRFLADFRSRVHYLFKKKKGAPEASLDGWTYEELRPRYFVCGEYGPVTFRPHYHLLLWFPRKITRSVESKLFEIISKSWSLGRIDFQQATTSGVNSYLSSYVTGNAGLPAFLRHKSVRPFSHSSTSPSLGSITVPDDKIYSALNTGVVERYKFDERAATFVDDPLPSSVLYRLFPKCRGFSRIDDNQKLRVYSYVFNYFKDRSIAHSHSDLDFLRLCDIAWPVKISIATGDLTEWSYTDKYASMQCYKYCVRLGITPDFFMHGVNRVHAHRMFQNIKDYYEYLEENKTPYAINYDRDFVYNLPNYADELTPTQYGYLVYCGVFDELYPNLELDCPTLFRLDFRNDPVYIDYRGLQSEKAVKSVKRKKMNDYKMRLNYG